MQAPKATPPIVLLVDDHHDTRDGYSEALSAAGCSVVEASTAEHALRRAATIRPAVVVTDLRLGQGADGLELCSRLRSLDATRQIPIIMVTGWTDEDVKRRAVEAGCSVVLTKPVTPHELMAAVARALEAESQEGAPFEIKRGRREPAP